MAINTNKLKFFWNEGYYYDIKAKSLATGKWEKVGTCNLASKAAIKAGNIELIKWERG